MFPSGRAKWRFGSKAAIGLLSAIAGFTVAEIATRVTQGGGRASIRTTGSETFRAESTAFKDTFSSARQIEADSAARDTFLESLANRLTPPEYPAAIRSTHQWPVRERKAFLLQVARRWAETDTQAAANAFSALDDIPLSASTAGVVIEIWARKSAGDALAWLCSYPEGILREKLVERFIATVEKTDPSRALAAFNLLPEKTRNADRRAGWIVQLTTTDIQAAAKAALAPRNLGKTDEETLRNVALQWVSTDPAGALAWEKTLDRGKAFSFRHAILTAWGEVNPPAAMRWIEQLDINRRVDNAVYVMHGWARKDPAAARAYAQSLAPGRDREFIFGSLIYALGTQRKDLAAAIEVHRDDDPSSDSRLLKYLPSILRDAEIDNRTAAEVIRGLPQDERNTNLLDSFLANWAEKDPSDVAAYLESSGLASRNPRAAGSVAKALAGIDPERALSWAMKLPGGSAREDAVSAAVLQLAAYDAKRAWSLCEANLPPDKHKEIAANVASGLVDRDPGSAIDWANRLADLEIRRNVFRAIGQAWADKAPESCMAWLESLKPGEMRDNAVQGFVSRAGFADSEAVVQWAASLEDADRRTALFSKAISQWNLRNPQGAEKWIKETNLLSPAAKQWLIHTNRDE